MDSKPQVKGFQGASPNHIDNDELVDRSVKLMKNCFKILPPDTIRVSSNAFADPEKRPSFFRRVLTDNPPYSNPPRRSETDAVVTLLAGDIRCPLDHQSGTGSKAVTTKYAVDIMPDTSGGQHRSHSVAYATPEWKSNGAFEKLKERLARLTEDFAIPPDPEFIRQLTDGP